MHINFQVNEYKVNSYAKIFFLPYKSNVLGCARKQKMKCKLAREEEIHIHWMRRKQAHKKRKRRFTRFGYKSEVSTQKKISKEKRKKWKSKDSENTAHGKVDYHQYHHSHRHYQREALKMNSVKRIVRK